MHFSNLILFLGLFFSICCITIKSIQHSGTFTNCNDLFKISDDKELKFPREYIRMIGRGTRKFIKICEHDNSGAFAVGYDTELRIPLYALTKITKEVVRKWKQEKINTNSASAGESRSFRYSCRIAKSLEENKLYQANINDYNRTKVRTACYVDKNSPHELKPDTSWHSTKKDPINDDCKLRKVPVDRGHLISVQHMKDPHVTMVYTNAVPQFATFNRGKWRTIENNIRTFTENCYNRERSDVVHVAVGVIPSTYNGKLFNKQITNDHERWFGKPGFGNGQFTPKVTFDNKTNNDNSSFRVNVPLAMWTSVVCWREGQKVMDRAYAAWNTPYNQAMPDSQPTRFMFWALFEGKPDIWKVEDIGDNNGNFGGNLGGNAAKRRQLG